MTIKNVYKVSVEGSATETLKFNNNTESTDVVEEIWVQLNDDCNLTVTGKVDESAEEETLTGINVGTLAKVSSITEKGIYIFITEGLQTATLTFTGTADVVIKEVV